MSLKREFELSKGEVVTKDISRLLLGVAQHVTECGGIEGAEASVAFHCTGWDDDPRGLWDIPEVHEYFVAIHKKFTPFPFFLAHEEVPAAGLYMRILAQPSMNPESVERMTQYLNEAMAAICQYCKDYNSAGNRKVSPVACCCRLYRVAGVNVKPKVLEKELKKRGML